jgi:predicted metalloprotease with PDZ domain
MNGIERTTSMILRTSLRDGSRSLLAAGLVVAAWAAVAAQAETLTYVLTPERGQGRIRVELTWQTAGRTASRLCVSPRWGTVADVPALLKDVKFSGASEARRDKACWQVTHAPGAELRCQYTVDPGRKTFEWTSTHHPIASKAFFHGLGNAFLITPATGGGQPDEYEVLLRWKLPDDWKAICSWGAGPSVGARLKPEDIRQSVYLAGRLVLYRTRVPGADELTIAMLDEFEFSAEEFGQRAAEIIADQCAFMRETSFPPFLVTAIPVGKPVEAGDLRIAGMGLYRSFALCVSPRATLTDGVEHLFAHELFHTWNGRLVQAAEPEELVYWFAEGFTDYYALRILYESGRWTPKVYAQWINRHVREYQANPARNASNEQIRAGYWKERDTVGEAPYQRGLLLGLRWHKLARDHGVREGIDALLRKLIERARRGDFRVSNDALREEGRVVLGDWFTPEFDRYVVRAETVEVPRDALAPDFVGRVESVSDFALGFDRERSLREQRVRGLVAGSAAAKAGLREGDELLGWDVHGDSDREIQLQVLRAGQLTKISYLPRGTRRDVLQFLPANE